MGLMGFTGSKVLGLGAVGVHRDSASFRFRV